MANARVDQLVREGYVQDASNARVVQLVREAFIKLPGIPNANVDQLVREAFVLDTAHARADQLVREVFCHELPHARVDQLVREAFVLLTTQTAGTMPIQYPLTIPSLLGESKADLTKFDAIGEFISEFTGNAEQQEWTDQHWELQLEWPEMNWPQFAAYDAFLGALHGKLGTFLWGPPLATAPRGSGSGAPFLNTVTAGATSIATQGWAVSSSGLLLPGDFFQLGPYSLTIAAVLVASGILFVKFSVSLISSSSIAAMLESSNIEVTFAGLTNATWLNGATLPVSAVSGGGGVTITVTFDAGPPGMPASYGLTSDTGTGSAGEARLYQYVDQNPLSSDGSGNATLDIFPNVREPYPIGTPLVLTNPQGTFRLADNRRTSSADQKKTITMKPLKCREAI